MRFAHWANTSPQRPVVFRSAVIYTCRAFNPDTAPKSISDSDSRGNLTAAGVAELVDAPDSKSGMGNHVRVRFSLPAPFLNSESLLAFDFINVSRNIVEGGR